jgi:hypothetical protein
LSAEQTHERPAHAREVIRLLLKAHKMRRLYTAQHAYCAAAISELGSSIRAYVTLHEVLRYEVRRDALVFEEERVYEEPNREANIAFGIFLGGVRSIAFQEEVADEELSDFLGILTDRRDDKDVATILWERELETIECVYLDELSDGWDAPEDLPAQDLDRLRAMNGRADQIIAELKQRRLLGEGGALYEMTDTAEEFERVTGLEEDASGPGELALSLLEGQQERARTFLAHAQAYDYAALLSRAVEVAVDGVTLRPAAIGLQHACWLISEAPLAALRRNDLALCAELLTGYARRRAEVVPAAARAFELAIEGVSAADRVDAIVELGTKESTPPAVLCRLLGLLGKAGVAAAVTALLAAKADDLRAALTRFLSDHAHEAPHELTRLVLPTASIESARWALFVASKSLDGPQAEALYEAGKRHERPEVREYAAFLWRTNTPQGRLRALLDALESPDAAERVRAAHALARARDREGIEPLKRLIEDPSFATRSVEEKRASLDALAAIAGAGVEVFLDRQTRRTTGLFRLRGGAEIRQAAEAALARVRRGKSA